MDYRIEPSQGDGWKITTPHGYIDYRHRPKDGLNEIWWVESHKRGHGSELVNLMQKHHPAETIAWGATSETGRGLMEKWHAAHPEVAKDDSGAFEGQFDPFSHDDYENDDDFNDDDDVADYAAAYSRVVRYATNSHDVSLLLREMATDPAHLEPGSPLRLALADALAENGQHDEAVHMGGDFRMSVRDGRPQLSTPRLHRLLFRLRPRHNRIDHLAGSPSEVRLEAARELDKLGRTHEAAILRSSHPIDTHISPLNSDGRLVASHTVTGNYPRFAYGGGEVAYTVGRGNNQGVLCHNCANGENRSPVLDSEYADDPRWALTHEVGGFVHEEGPPIQCDHCNRDIQAAYGDPDQPDDADS